MGGCGGRELRAAGQLRPRWVLLEEQHRSGRLLAQRKLRACHAYARDQVVVIKRLAFEHPQLSSNCDKVQRYLRAISHT